MKVDLYIESSSMLCEDAVVDENELRYMKRTGEVKEGSGLEEFLTDLMCDIDFNKNASHESFYRVEHEGKTIASTFPKDDKLERLRDIAYRAFDELMEGAEDWYQDEIPDRLGTSIEELKELGVLPDYY